jgi:hypothetical protein
LVNPAWLSNGNLELNGIGPKPAFGGGRDGVSRPPLFKPGQPVHPIRLGRFSWAVHLRRPKTAVRSPLPPFTPLPIRKKSRQALTRRPKSLTRRSKIIITPPSISTLVKNSQLTGEIIPSGV